MHTRYPVHGGPELPSSDVADLLPTRGTSRDEHTRREPATGNSFGGRGYHPNELRRPLARVFGPTFPFHHANGVLPADWREPIALGQSERCGEVSTCGAPAAHEVTIDCATFRQRALTRI